MANRDDAGEAKTVRHYVCANCKRVITHPKGGFCVQGNVYVADPDSRGGLIGNNIDAGPDGGIAAVRETVLCRACFCEALGLDGYALRTEADDFADDLETLDYPVDGGAPAKRPEEPLPDPRRQVAQEVLGDPLSAPDPGREITPAAAPGPRRSRA